MKKAIVLTVLLFSLFTICKAQVNFIKVTKLQDKELIYILNNIDTVYNNNNNELSVRLYKIGNPSGSAHQEGTDEISHKFLIAVSEDGEHPEQYLYTVGDFLFPKVIKFAALDKKRFVALIEYGQKNFRKLTRLNISLEGVSTDALTKKK